MKLSLVFVVFQAAAAVAISSSNSKQLSSYSDPDSDSSLGTPGWDAPYPEYEDPPLDATAKHLERMIENLEHDLWKTEDEIKGLEKRYRGDFKMLAH